MSQIKVGQVRIAVVAVIGIVIALLSAYTVETGNVSVERTLGRVDHEEQQQGLNFKMPLVTVALEFSAKRSPWTSTT